MKKMWKKTLSLLMTLSMVITMVPAVAWAENTCTHIHDSSCGYVKEVIGVACSYPDGIECDHTGDCGYAAAVEAVDCSYPDGIECDHKDCGFIEGQAEVPCLIEGCTHDTEDCQYKPAVEGKPCGNNGVVTCNHENDCAFVAAQEAKPCANEGVLLPCDHKGDCAFVAAVAGADCTHKCDTECGGVAADEPVLQSEQQEQQTQSSQQEPVLMMSPTPVAEPVVDGKLDISGGSIVITATGYIQGESDEVAWRDEYVISGASDSNTLTVSGGTEASPLKITFSGASMRKFIIGDNSYVKLTLQGSNSVTPAAMEGTQYAERDTAIVLPVASTLVLEGNGDFTVTGGGFSNHPIAAGQSMKGGTVIQNTTGNVSWISQAKGNGAGPNLTKYVLNSGTFNGKKTDGKNVSMTADYFEKNGGTNTAKLNYFDSVTNITITQGLYDGVLAPKGDDGIAASARYRLQIGDNRAYWKSSPVTVSYGTKEYTYNTDENGNIDFFAPATVDTISIKVNETTYTLSKEDYGNQTEVKYVGPECTCDTDPGTFILDEETTSAADGVYIYKTATLSKTLSLKGVYTPKDACLALYHTNYVTSTWEITAITKNGTSVDADKYDDYAELNDSVLTLKYADADYIVSIKGTVGTTNKVTTETLAVAAKIYKATTDHVLDIADGNITVTAGTDENEGKVVYTQGGTSFAVAPDNKVTITGTAAANSGNIIKVDNCSPSIILHNVIVTPASSSKSPILISGDSHAKIYISGTNELIEHISGKAPTRNICGIELSSSDAENPAKVTIDCMEGSDCNDKSCPHKLYVYADLGAGIGAGQNAAPFFEVNIEGGHIIAHPGNYGTGIGSGWKSTAQFTVNIRDGFVEADGGDFAALIGYGRGANSENVKVNISGGIVEATSIFSDSGQAAIQAGIINISGAETVVDVIGGVSATQAIFVSDGATLSVAEKTVPEGATGGNPGFVSGTVIVEASASFDASVERENNTVIVPMDKTVVFNNDGTMTLPEGTVVEKPDGMTVTLPYGGTMNADGTITANTIITENTDGTVTFTKGDEVTTITSAAGENIDVNSDGTMTLPDGTVVEKSDGTTVTLPNGGTMYADGRIVANTIITANTDGTLTITKDDKVITITPPTEGEVTIENGEITLPAGTKVTTDDNTVEIKAPVTSVVIPVDGLGDVEVTDDGNITLPEGSEVTTEDGTTVAIIEGSGSLSEDGTVTLDGKSSANVTVTDEEGNKTETTVETGEGASATVGDGEIEVTAGTTIGEGENAVEVPDTVASVTVPADKLDDVSEDESGNITLPAGSAVTKKDGTTVALPNGGQIISSGEVIVTPGADSGDNGNTDEDDNNTPSRLSTSNKPSSKKYSASIDTDDIENGSVKLSSSSAKKGSTVTITVTPDAGYMLDELTVTDKDGNKVALKDLGNGKYSFVMPKGGVDVDASFKEADGSEPVVDTKETTIVLTIDSKVILINGEYVLNDVAPIIQGDRTFLPIRVIAEALGATVTWNEAEQSVTIVKGDTTIVLYIGQLFALVNGEPVQLDVPAFISNDRTYLPIRFISENLGATVTWDGLTRTVIIIG